MLTVENICVNYSYKKVLTGVNVSFEKGRIYALLGENGAGKSTLAHIICGDLQPTSGRLVLNGKAVSFANPAQALQKKIACVHQRPLLADSISIEENLLLGTEKISKQQIKNQLKLWLPDLNSKTLVKKLTPDQKFFTALAGILLKKPEILILDEPTALLNNDQSCLLFDELRKLAEAGTTIILITHFLDEALKQADQLVILRDGIVKAFGKSCEFSEQTIKKLLFESKNDDTAEVTTTLNTRFSEIEKSVTDENTLTGMNSNYIRTLRKNKTAVIPSDRTFRASNPKLTILQLVTAYKTKLSKKELWKYAEKITKKADVNIKLNEKAGCLSGGMLQRLILERELDTNPDTIIFCSPFQGLDAAATEKLKKVLVEEKEKGKKVIIT